MSRRTARSDEKSKTGGETNETPGRAWQKTRPETKGRVLTKEGKEEDSEKKRNENENENEENNREKEGEKRTRTSLRERKERGEGGKEIEGCCTKEVRTKEERTEEGTKINRRRYTR